MAILTTSCCFFLIFSFLSLLFCPEQDRFNLVKPVLFNRREEKNKRKGGGKLKICSGDQCGAAGKG